MKKIGVVLGGCGVYDGSDIHEAVITLLAMLSFVVFAIFAYGGIEAVGGLVDKTDKPEKNFAKGIIIAAIVISIGYSLAIVLWGVSANWQQVLGARSTNLGNITYVLMTSLGATLGQALHLTPAAAPAPDCCYPSPASPRRWSNRQSSSAGYSAR